ncbi:MAG: T9SS type A sorting domain-containing protein [Saprospiraceae bacterium]|nr:T9SS type A sorting domain-containing protein [Candidatus Brachybacter algidus]
MKKTNFTDRLKSKMNFNPAVGLFFVLCLFLFNNNLNAQCSPACTSSNISVDADCEALITLPMVVQAASLIGCGGLYTINLKATMTGPILETATNSFIIADGLSPANVPYSLIGKTYVLEYVSISTGNSCWNWHTFEDKLAPEIFCGSDTIPCYADVNFANINPFDCSGPVTPHILSMTTVELPCTEENEGYLRRIFRTYYATDAVGNASDTCTDTIVIERPNLDSIDYPATDTVYCDQAYAKDANGHPSSTVTGVPTIGDAEVPLFPNNLMNVCGLFTSYTDQIIDLGCMVKVMRSWTVTEWYCVTDYEDNHLQIIFILDTVPPVLTIPNDFTVNTNNFDCFANVLIPPAVATDNCQTTLKWNVSYPGGFKTQNGGFTVKLPVGVHNIIYSVNDGCINNTIDTLQITVADAVAPNAICIENTVASIPNGSNYVRVPAASFDNGSWDNCGPVTFKVARMVADCNGDDDKQTDQQDYIDFYCCDIANNPIQIRLFVYDQSGNVSECMVSIKIQDKTNPILTIPPDMWVPCEYAYNPEDLGFTFGYVYTDGTPRRTDTIYTDVQGNYYVGYLDGVATDNCNVVITEEVDTDFTDCGSGTITRTFTATDPFGNKVTKTQVIHIYKNPLYLYKEYFDAPNDTMIIDGPCVVDNLDPDDLPDAQRPIFLLDQVTTCFNLAYNHRDEVYYGLPDACFKIIRYWTIIDWCYASTYGLEAALETAVHFTSIIKVRNTVAPVFAPIADILAVSEDTDCFQELVSVSNSATDDCTPTNQLKYNYKIDYNYSTSGTPTWDAVGQGNNASGLYPLGVHRVCFYATDLCGNVGESCLIVTVINRKKPTPVAHHLVTEIMPSTGTITLPAIFFDAGSFANCGGPLQYSFSSDVNDNIVTFDCDDIGNNPPASIEFWVTDIYGNQDYVVVTVIIQDNNNVCDGNITTFVAGKIVTEKSEGIPKVAVSGAGNTNTTNEGTYKFNSINAGSSYVIKPQSDRDPLNGVETGDIIKIQNHLLNKKALDGPYKIIAADVTMDNKLTVADIVAMRRLILGKDEQFPSGQSWRFVDKAFQFANPANPFASAFPEQISVVPNATMNDLDFFGMKLGDVNNNVTLSLNGDNDIEVRDLKTLSFTADDQIIPAGIATQITFKVSDFASIEGFQMAVNAAQGVAIKNIESNDLNFGTDNFNLVSDSKAKLSWNNDGVSSTEGALTFTIISNKDIKVSEALSVDAQDLKATAYGSDESEYKVDMKFNGSSNEGVTVFQNRPNPFSDETRIGVTLPENLDVTLKIYDINGRTIYQTTKQYAKGSNEILINANMINANGVLYYEVSTKYGTEMRKMIRLKN